MIYTGLNRTGEIETVKAHGGYDVAEVYGGINESNPIYYKSRTITGQTPLNYKALSKPISDYLISGNTLQDGTPSPDMPVDVVGCGERTGNLFSSTWEQGDVDGTTGQNINSIQIVRTKNYISIKPNTVYLFSRNPSNGFMNLRLYRADKSYIGPGSNSTIRLISGTSAGNPMGDGVSFCCFEVIDSEAAYIRFNDVSNSTAAKWHMVEGEYTRQTMPEYEPYGYNLPLTVNGTEYPIYLGQVESTRKVKKLVLTGREPNWNVASTNLWHLQISNIPAVTILDSRSLYCTHYNGVASKTTYSGLTNGNACIYSSVFIWIRDSQFASLADFKGYLAQQYANGTPVTVWYVLATPETAVINEPLHKIGDYADTISMAQAGVTISTVSDANVLDMTSTVKPSAVSITGNIKPTGYGQLLDVNDIDIQDSTGEPVYIQG